MCTVAYVYIASCMRNYVSNNNNNSICIICSHIICMYLYNEREEEEENRMYVYVCNICVINVYVSYCGLCNV